MTATNSVQFKTTSFKTNIAISLIIGVTLSIFLYIIFDNFTFLTGIREEVAIIISIIISPFITNFISNNTTTISIENHQLFISTETAFLYKLQEKTFLIDDIICYEVYQNKIFKHIILYRKNELPYHFILGSQARSSIVKIVTFLEENNFIIINKKGHLTEESFKHRFKNTLLFNAVFVFSTTLITLFIATYYFNTHFKLSGKYLFYGGVAIGSSYYYLNQKIWGKKSKYGAINTCTYISVFALLLSISYCSKNLNILFKNPLNILNINEVADLGKNSFFRLEDYNFKKNSISKKQTKTRNNKTKYYTITNSYRVLFNKTDRKFSDYPTNLYILEYSFRHKKNSIEPERLASTIEYDDRQFNYIINNKSIPLFELENIYSKKNRNRAASYYIIKPHFIDFNTLKEKQQTYLFNALITLFGICLVNSFIMARNR